MLRGGCWRFDSPHGSSGSTTSSATPPNGRRRCPKLWSPRPRHDEPPACLDGWAWLDGVVVPDSCDGARLDSFSSRQPLLLGITSSVGWTSERWPRFLSQSLHRNLSLFCLALVVVHVVTTVADGYVPIGFADAVIPFRSPYRPLWVGLGAVAFDLLLAGGNHQRAAAAHRDS